MSDYKIINHRRDSDHPSHIWISYHKNAGHYADVQNGYSHDPALAFKCVRHSGIAWSYTDYFPTQAQAEQAAIDWLNTNLADYFKPAPRPLTKRYNA